MATYFYQLWDAESPMESVDGGGTSLEGLAELGAVIPSQPLAILQSEAAGHADANTVRDWRT